MPHQEFATKIKILLNGVREFGLNHPRGHASIYCASSVLNIRSSELVFTLRSRNMNGSPAGTSSFTQATPGSVLASVVLLLHQEK